MALFMELQAVFEVCNNLYVNYIPPERVQAFDTYCGTNLAGSIANPTFVLPKKSNATLTNGEIAAKPLILAAMAVAAPLLLF